jgi:hypothetical protein
MLEQNTTHPGNHSLRPYVAPPGIRADFLEWQMDLLPGASVELIEIKPGSVSLSEIYVKPGTILELEEVEQLEYKLAL